MLTSVLRQHRVCAIGAAFLAFAGPTPAADEATVSWNARLAALSVEREINPPMTVATCRTLGLDAMMREIDDDEKKKLAVCDQVIGPDSPDFYAITPDRPENEIDRLLKNLWLNV